MESPACCFQVFGLYLFCGEGEGCFILMAEEKGTEVLHLQSANCYSQLKCLEIITLVSCQRFLFVGTLTKEVIPLKFAGVTILPIIPEAWLLSFTLLSEFQACKTIFKFFY